MIQRMQYPLQTIQGLMKIKELLHQCGVTISLTDPDVLAKQLSTLEDTEDAYLKACYEELKEILHNHDRIHILPTSHSRLTCETCQNTIRVHVDSQVSVANPENVCCLCGTWFRVAVNQREHPRKTVHLPGIYLQEQNGEHTGNMVVKDISCAGVRIQSLAPHTITVGEKLLLSFALDDDAGAVIREAVYVCYIVGKFIGAKFLNKQTYNQALGAYLGDT